MQENISFNFENITTIPCGGERMAPQKSFFVMKKANTWVLEASQRPLAFGQGFGLVLLDPPYALEPAQVAAFLVRLRQHGDLARGAVAVYEHALAKQGEVQDELGRLEGFELTGVKKYGKVGVAYLELKEEQDA